MAESLLCMVRGAEVKDGKVSEGGRIFILLVFQNTFTKFNISIAGNGNVSFGFRYLGDQVGSHLNSVCHGPSDL